MEKSPYPLYADMLLLYVHMPRREIALSFKSSNRNFTSCWTVFTSCWTVFTSGWTVFTSCWMVFTSGWMVFTSCWTVFTSCWTVFTSCWTVFTSCWGSSLPAERSSLPAGRSSLPAGWSRKTKIKKINNADSNATLSKWPTQMQLCQNESLQAFTTVSGRSSAKEDWADTNSYWKPL